ncbi:RraA family protein [Streptomyces nigrescens]|uniref:Putative 4-hydroxy-4-methyl-2-oxoglutarate aldolase n=1 Tax=Streptomyces nigrescens TaxID=1920 RepID=A0ABY7IZQ9_STRNI|nr:RraA family protein [Streptomyces nigrescens]WAU03815.1 RraA family protein [Streptomyces nigrescens]
MVVDADNTPPLSACQVSDVLDSIGLRQQVVMAGLRPLQQGTMIAGRAATVQFVPTESDSDAPYDDMIAFIDSLRPGDLVVAATNADRRTAYWGELFSAAAMGRGAVGTVTDGCIRDTEKIHHLDYAVFSVGHRPIDYRARMRVAAVRCAVRIGGVVVNDGDKVVADDDGIVVVPATAWDDVRTQASRRRSTENAVLSDLLAGETLRTVWDKYRTL